MFQWMSWNQAPYFSNQIRGGILFLWKVSIITKTIFVVWFFKINNGQQNKSRGACLIVLSLSHQMFTHNLAFLRRLTRHCAEVAQIQINVPTIPASN